jgi:hypothetical protein
VLVLVLMKFNTCPGVTVKYSGTFAGIRVALLAVTTVVLSMEDNPHLSRLTAEWRS